MSEWSRGGALVPRRSAVAAAAAFGEERPIVLVVGRQPTRRGGSFTFANRSRCRPDLSRSRTPSGSRASTGRRARSRTSSALKISSLRAPGSVEAVADGNVELRGRGPGRGGVSRGDVRLSGFARRPTRAPRRSWPAINWWSLLLYPRGPDANDRMYRASLTLPRAGSSARRCPSWPRKTGGEHRLRSGLTRDAHRLARCSRASTSGPSTCRPETASGIPGHRRRQSRLDRRSAPRTSPTIGASSPRRGRSSARGTTAATTSPLAHGPAAVDGPRAPRVERQPRPRARAPRRLGPTRSRDAALARVRPFLERQVPDAGGLVSGRLGRLPGSGGQRAALGLRGPDRVLRRSARRAQRPPLAGALRARRSPSSSSRDGPQAGRAGGRSSTPPPRRSSSTTAGPSGRPGAAASTSTPRARSSGSTRTSSSARSRGARSRSTTSRARFTAAPAAAPAVKTYTAQDVFAALNAVAPYDWAAFFRERVDGSLRRRPVGGIENGGWKLAYREEQARAGRGDRGRDGSVRLLGFPRDRRAGRRHGRPRGHRGRRARNAGGGRRRRAGHAARRGRGPPLRDGASPRRAAARAPERRAHRASGRKRRRSTGPVASTTAAARGTPAWSGSRRKPDLLSAIGRPRAPAPGAP